MSSIVREDNRWCAMCLPVCANTLALDKIDVCKMVCDANKHIKNWGTSHTFCDREAHCTLRSNVTLVKKPPYWYTYHLQVHSHTISVAHAHVT